MLPNYPLHCTIIIIIIIIIIVLIVRGNVYKQDMYGMSITFLLMNKCEAPFLKMKLMEISEFFYLNINKKIGPTNMETRECV